MLRFDNLERALQALSQSLHTQLIEKVDDTVAKKARSLANKIDREVGKYFSYLEEIIPSQRHPGRLATGGGKPWHKLEQSWTDRKVKAGMKTLPSYFRGTSRLKGRGDSLEEFVYNISNKADKAFLGETIVEAITKKAWNPSDARQISWTTQTGRTQSAWFGTRESGGQGFIRRPSDKDLTQATLHVMPAISAVGGLLHGKGLEKVLKDRLVNKYDEGDKQGIKLIGRNRQILAPLLRWMYITKISRIIREAGK